jgi:hypothetical protein
MSSSTRAKPVDSSASTASGGGEARSPTNPVWQAAIEKYYGELAKGGIKASMIDKDLWDVRGPDELIAQIEALVPIQAVQSNTWSKALSRLQPIVLGLNDFVAVTAWAVGMNGKLAAVLWGSIRLIIKVCLFRSEEALGIWLLMSYTCDAKVRPTRSTRCHRDA